MKTMLILARECRLRLRRPAFWIFTLIVPAVLALLYALPVIAARHATEPTTVLVVDQTGLFDGTLHDTDLLHFKTMPSLNYAKQHAAGGELVLFIPMRETTIPRDAFLYYHGTAPSVAVHSAVDAQLQTQLHNAILEDVYGLDPEVFRSVEGATLRLHTHDAATGHESHLKVRSVVAVALAVLMALALLLFGRQVARAIQEERHSRMAEIVATSVNPVQLLVGKVAGIALVATLQLILWIVLTATAIAVIQSANPDLFHTNSQLTGLSAIQLPLLGTAFVLFFLMGYMLYGTLIAAITSLLDAEADAGQWSLLVGSPLLLALAMTPFVICAPSGALATWLTFVPFTAPVAVMLRLPFGLSLWHLAFAAILLIALSAATSLLAARTYRRHIV